MIFDWKKDIPFLNIMEDILNSNAIFNMEKDIELKSKNCTHPYEWRVCRCICKCIICNKLIPLKNGYLQHFYSPNPRHRDMIYIQAKCIIYRSYL